MGVHTACAGFNRTGFVVCAYLIQVCRLNVQEALAAFGTARPPGVKHEKFVVELARCDATTPAICLCSPFLQCPSTR